MIQQAFISGQLGMAIYMDNRQRMVLNAEDLGRPSGCTGHDLSMFFHSGAEFSLLTGPVKDLQQLAGSLERETRAHTALTLVLCSMDPSLDETRLLSIEAAEELLQDDNVRSFVKRRLLARPLPESADMEGARSGAALVCAPVLSALFGAVEESQPAIQAVLQAWNHAAKGHFATPEQAADAESALIELGVFDELVSVMAQGSPEDLDSLVVRFGFDQKILANIPRVAQLLKAMNSSLASLPRQMRHTRIAAKEHTARKSRGDVRDLLDGFEEGRAGRPRKAISPSRVKARLDSQIASIAKLIREHNLRTAEEWLEDLIQFQVGHGKKEHLAMSLCNLATVAISTNAFEFASALLGHAEALGIQDPVISHIKANVFSTTRRFAEALVEYDGLIQRFPNDPVGYSGRAEVLRAMGSFFEALATYDTAIHHFPDNFVVRNGRAEVLKAMGRFAEALQAFDEVIGLFPNNVVAWNGRAEVLKAMGHFTEALEAFDEVIGLFPDNFVARIGRAEVLKAMGHFDAALRIFDEVIGLFPRNVVARTGRAEVLKAMGRFAEALGAFDGVIGVFPNAAIARNGRAEVLKAMGRFPEALQAYQETIGLFPDNAVARSGRAEVLKIMGRFTEALAAYDEAVRLFPAVAIASAARVDVLNAMGRLAHHTLDGSAATLLLMDKVDAARDLLSREVPPVSKDDWSRYHILSMAYVKSGKDWNKAIKRLSHGSQDAPWQETRNRFTNSLAVAWIRQQNYENALQLLQRDIDVLEAVEKQKRRALIGHSYAAIDNRQEAVNSLNSLQGVGDPNLASLKGLLFDRYSLSDRRVIPVQPATLDSKIAQHEFALAMA
jgi:tetratricopeptide (TPR) repeat protein